MSASPNPARLASISAEPTMPDSVSTSSPMRSVNHGAMPVAAARLAASAQPWRRSATIATAACRRRQESSRSPGRRCVSSQAGSSQPARPRGSSRRTAFSSAGPNSRSIAIASPVAFIWTPRLRSATGNLSNGQRGTLDDDVVDRRSNAAEFPGGRVRQLVQALAETHRRRSGDRIPGRLRCRALERETRGFTSITR